MLLTVFFIVSYVSYMSLHERTSHILCMVETDRMDDWIRCLLLCISLKKMELSGTASPHSKFECTIEMLRRRAHFTISTSLRCLPVNGTTCLESIPRLIDTYASRDRIMPAPPHRHSYASSTCPTRVRACLRSERSMRLKLSTLTNVSSSTRAIHDDDVLKRDNKRK